MSFGIGLVIGLLIGWNFPQPAWVKAKIDSWTKK